MVAVVTLVGYQRVSPPNQAAQLLLTAVWLCVTFLAAYGAGTVFAGVLKGPGETQLERIVLTAAIGAGLLALAAAIVSSVGLLRPVVLGTIFGVATIVGVLRTLKTLRIPTLEPALTPPWLIIGLVTTATLLALPALSSFYDQWNYHLAFPFQWLRHGEMAVFPRHEYSFLPANMGLLYLYGLAVLGSWSCQAIHWGMGALSVLAIAGLAREAGAKEGAVWAASFFVATPAVIQLVTHAGADLGVVAWSSAAWLMLISASRRGKLSNPSWWFVCGALVGLAAGCKILALATVAAPMAVTAIFLLAAENLPLRRKIQVLASWSLGLVLVFGPWAARNTILAGNPFHPFLGSHFGTAERQIMTKPSILLSGFDLSTTAELAQSAATLRTFRPEGHAGDIGPIYLAMLPLVVVLVLSQRVRAQRVLCFGYFITIAAWAVLPQLGRYLLPALVLGAALSGTAWESLTRRWAPAASRLLGLLLCGVLIWVAIGGVDRLDVLRAASTLGVYDNAETLKRNVSHWPALKYIEQDVPEDAKLLFVGESRAFLVNRELIVDGPFEDPYILELAEAASSPFDLVAELQGLGVTHLLLNQHEAERIARMNGKTTFMDGVSALAASNLNGLLQSHAEVAFAEGPVRVLRLLPLNTEDRPGVRE